MQLSLDLETYSSVPIAKCGAHKYTASPDFQILLCSYSADGGPAQCVDLTKPGGLEFFNGPLRATILHPDTTLHAYNAAFEALCLARHWDLPLTREYIAKFRCTMVHGLYCGYPAGLAAIGRAL